MTGAKTTSLGGRFDRFVEYQIESGAYGSPDEVLRAGLELLERREQKKNALRDALSEGEASADYQEIDWERFLSGEEPSARASR